MAIYLKKFETQAAYEAAESSLILPNVSLTVDNNTVHYNPSSPTPPTPTHDYVEIGGVKWATMNIGANSVTDYGLYFAWGETSGYTAAQVTGSTPIKCFGWGDGVDCSDYKFAPNGIVWDDPNFGLTKYNNTDGLTVLTSTDDAVQANWGGSWRMPTTAEYEALGNAVNTAWTADYQGSGIAGLVCTDKTDSSKTLFFPAVGHCFNGRIEALGEHMQYWSSSLLTDGVDCAYYFTFSSEWGSWGYDDSRYFGCAMRGVLDE